MFPHDVEVVGHHDDGKIFFFPELMQESINSLFATNVYPRGCLIKNQDFWAVHKCPCDQHALKLAG